MATNIILILITHPGTKYEKEPPRYSYFHMQTYILFPSKKSKDRVPRWWRGPGTFPLFLTLNKFSGIWGPWRPALFLGYALLYLLLVGKGKFKTIPVVGDTGSSVICSAIWSFLMGRRSKPPWRSIRISTSGQCYECTDTFLSHLTKKKYNHHQVHYNWTPPPSDLRHLPTHPRTSYTGFSFSFIHPYTLMDIETTRTYVCVYVGAGTYPIPSSFIHACVPSTQLPSQSKFDFFLLLRALSFVFFKSPRFYVLRWGFTPKPKPNPLYPHVK